MPVAHDYPATAEGIGTAARIKKKANELAAVIEDLDPSMRRHHALTFLETACMWAVKAAIQGDED